MMELVATSRRGCAMIVHVLRKSEACVSHLGIKAKERSEDEEFGRDNRFSVVITYMVISIHQPPSTHKLKIPISNKH